MRKTLSIAVVLLIVFSMSAFAGGAGRSDDTYEIVFIPKLVGIPWFTAMENGFKDYAEEVGDVKTRFQDQRAWRPRY